MSEFTLYYNAGISVSVKVEADDIDEAIDKGYEALPGGICAQCGGWGSDYSREEGDYEFDESKYEVDGEFVTKATS